ncbi:hypothetical protein V8J82_10260 [Gymnodinialimonas sp. 2305UL16-5]|uniref:hypothetical protein n=1 Tax=Gymnodinialimonas mytili TaxID=3126503 RepID=UPI00309FD637
MLRVFTLAAMLVVPFSMAALAQNAEETPPEAEVSPEVANVEPDMTVTRLASIVTALDPDATIEPRGMSFTVASVPVTIVMDPIADRMRILVPISSSEALGEAELLRLMQANFDTALDARYAVANGRLWSTYIHPLSPLQTEQVISGIAQTVTLAQTYGDSFTSGAIMFGGGDTPGLIRELLDLGQEL